MSRFTFLKYDFPILWDKCSQVEQATDNSLIMLKIRQILEYLVFTLGAPDDQSLFYGINYLNDKDILDTTRSELFHQTRRYSNKVVHSIEPQKISEDMIIAARNNLVEITIWYSMEYCKHTYSLNKFAAEDLGIAQKYLTAKTARNGKALAATVENPLNLLDSFTPTAHKIQEVWEKDTFETYAEYQERIAKLPPLHIGYAILDTRKNDGYSKIHLLQHHLDKKEKLALPQTPLYFFVENFPTRDVIDGELFASLSVSNKQAVYDYSSIYLHTDEYDIPLKIICWQPLPNETQEQYALRLEQLPVLPLAQCKPLRQKYDIENNILPLEIHAFIYTAEIHLPTELLIHCTCAVSKKICQKQEPYILFGKLDTRLKLNKYIIWQHNTGVIYDNDTEQLHKTKNITSLLQKASSATPQSKFMLYQEAAKLGSVEALNSLGNCYYDGTGVAQDYAKAFSYYLEAAKQGYAKAFFNLGYCYYNGTGVTKNHEQAVKYYQEAAAHNFADAQYYLADCYFNGLGIEQSYTQAINLYKKAALQNHVPAQNMLAFCYSSGTGVSCNLQEALTWYKKAADSGDATAQFTLGKYYAEGQGVKKDLTIAKQWLEKASKQNYLPAEKLLQKLQSTKKSGCFITTATCLTLGKEDNCYELHAFRKFRDYWLLQQNDGQALIDEYYRLAPQIVAKINQETNYQEIYAELWQTYLLPCLKMLESKDFINCKQKYMDMVHNLQKKYLV